MSVRITIDSAVRFSAAASRTRPVIIDLLRLMIRRQRERRALAGLDDRMLRDLGISRSDAMHEANKPFWRR